MDLSNFKGCPPPEPHTLVGRTIRLEPMDPDAHSSLTKALCGPGTEALWDYIPFPPPAPEALFPTLMGTAGALGWIPFVLVDPQTDESLGTASLMRIRPEHGSAEIGCVIFGHALQRTAAATEALYLTASYLFDTIGYRRYEWKCNNENEASKRAALRFGFQYEGLFRNDMVIKGKNRDTAWFAMTDQDWKSLRPAYETWLAPENFDEGGRQRKSLAAIASFDQMGRAR